AAPGFFGELHRFGRHLFSTGLRMAGVSVGFVGRTDAEQDEGEHQTARNVDRVHAGAAVPAVATITSPVAEPANAPVERQPTQEASKERQRRSNTGDRVDYPIH